MPEHPVEIRLIIPGAPEFLRLARLAAADAGSRAGLTYDEIEDLRIGVDELCHSVMRPDGTGVVTLVFQLFAYVRRIRYEEAEMIERLGEEYVTYTREVRALVPLLW